MSVPSATPSHWSRRQQDSPESLAVISLATAIVLGLMLGAAADHDAQVVLRFLALVPVAAAAYRRHGLRDTLLVASLFSTAFIPQVIPSAGTPAFTTQLIGLATFVLLLTLFAFISANVAASVRARRYLPQALRDWQALLSSASDLEDVTHYMLRAALALVPAQRATLLLRNPLDPESWTITGIPGNRPPGTMVRRPDGWLSLSEWLIQRGASQVIDDLDATPYLIMPPTTTDTKHRSLVARPVRDSQGALLGMLVLQDKPSGPFTGEDVEALDQLIADSGSALKQASLFTRTDQALAHQVHRLAALQRTARELNASLDAGQIVQHTLMCALELTAGEVAVVTAMADDLKQAQAVHGTSTGGLHGTTLLAQAGKLTRTTVTPLPGAVELQPSASVRARILTPIRHEGRLLGAILAESKEPQALNQDTLRVLDSLADHAAVALENTRLFREIQREKGKVEQIILNMTDGLMTTDQDGRVIGMNQSATVLTGWDAQDAVGRSLCDILGCLKPEDCRQSCTMRNALLAGQTLQEETWPVRHRYGHERVVALSASPLPEASDQGPSMVILLHDITQRQEAERMQRELITSFSHELRTPLTSIDAITDMLLSDRQYVDLSQQHEHLEILRTQSRRLTAFAQRLLDIFRLEAGDWQLESRPIPIDYVIDEVLRHWRTTAPNHTFLYQAAESRWIWADETSLITVLNSLVDNAVKYGAESGTIVVRVDNGPPDHITIAVVDQGPGIALQHQGKLFQRFFRIDGGDAQQVYGHGLGLYIARALVEAMGGTIWVASQPGSGSQFCFTLPLAERNTGEDPDYRG